MQGAPRKLAAAYLGAATAWILISDLIVRYSPQAGPMAQTVKGGVFALVTSVLLYLLLHRWETRLLTSEAARDLFKSLYEQLDDGVAILDGDRRVTDCNAALSRMLGYSRREMLGRDTTRLRMGPERTAQDAYDRQLAEMGVVRSEAQLRHRDGHGVDAELVVVRIDSRRRLCILRDITARRSHERWVAEQREYVNALLGNITDVVTVVNDEGKVVFVSPSVERALGFRPPELLGEPALELVHREDRDRVARALAAARQAPGSVHAAAYRCATRAGGWIQVESQGMHPADGGLQGTVISSRDVTEQRAAERALRDKDSQLQQAQKLEAVGRLAGGIAHDFNNLLTVVFSHAALLQHELERGTTAYQDVQTIYDAAQRGAKLTEQLLLFSRERVVQPIQLDVNGAIGSVEAVLARLIGEDISLSFDLSPTAPPLLMDEGEFAQVLMNLAVNARDAMPRGGTLCISSAVAEVAEAEAEHLGVRPGRYAEITVSDTGAGVAPEALPHLFEPFFTTKDASQGSGLGLAVSYGIVAAAGGRIDVDSRPGMGTCFRILLPEGRAEPSESRALAPETERGQGETVLLVEDDEALRAATRRLLIRAGYHVLEASCASDALVAADRERVDLLVTDVVMPGSTGRELAVELFARGSCDRVLYLSGYTADELLRREIARDDGALLLRKPFTELQLRSRVRDALQVRPPRR